MHTTDRTSAGFRIEYLPMLIVTFFWAIGHPLGRIIVRQVHPFQLGAVTLTTGCIGLFIFLIASGRVKKFREINRKDTIVSLALGFSGFFLYQIFTFSALARIPASMNAVLVSTNVVFIALLAGLILHEKIIPPRIASIALALLGVMLVTFNRGFRLDGDTNIGFLGCSFSLMGALAFAFYSVIGKRIVARNDPLIVASLGLLSGSIMLILFAGVTRGFSEVFSAGPRIFLLMVMLGLTMIGIAYPLWFTCLKRLPASHASIYIYLTPVFAVILSLIILRERFAWPFWLGGACILGGVILTNRFAAAAVRKNSG
jgi:drug/metabolite transporter (DMT)-like permease